MMATRSNKYIRSETVVSDDSDTNTKTIVSSYTVDPEILFSKDETGNYQHYIDTSMTTTKDTEEVISNEFLIHLSSSEEESDFIDDDEDDEDEDVLEHNEDYVVLI